MDNDTQQTHVEAPAILGNNKDLLSLIYSYKQMRENYEPLSYLSRRAYEGKHFIFWDRDQRQIQEIPIKKTFFNQMPEVSKQCDSFENFLLSTDFVFTITPKLLSDDTSTRDSTYLSILAKDFYDKLKSSTVFADFVHYAILDNVSFIEVYPDMVNNTVGYRQFDFFDIVFNPMIKNWDEQRLVVKVVRRKVAELKSSKLYHLPDDYQPMGGSDFLSWKDIYQQEKYSQFANINTDETLIFECFILDPDKGLKIMALDPAANIIRDDNYPNIKVMPIIPLRIFSGEWYQPSYCYRQIPINRSIDTLASRFDDIILKLAKGGWIMQEEEEIDGGMNEEVGQMITYQTTKPEPIQMGTVPSFFPQWYSMLLGMSDRYGISTLFSGGLPNKASGLRSNKMIESLKGSTLQNNTSTINNLKSCTEDILRVTFAFLYEMWNTPQEMLDEEMGDQKAPKFVSAKYKALFNDDNIVHIPNDFKRFNVEVDNGLGYTLDERKKTAVTLNKIIDPTSGKPLLSFQALQKIFKLGSSSYLMEADDPIMAQTPEFKQLINDFPNMSKDDQQAVIKVLSMVGQKVGNNPKAQVMPPGIQLPNGQPAKSQQQQQQQVVQKTMPQNPGAPDLGGGQ